MEREPIYDVDRLSVRVPPSGWPIMYQYWGKLLFLHWSLPVELLRPLIPDPLIVDTFDGTAWIGVTPFTMWGMRPVILPSVPVLSDSHELNVRTYVHLDGVPGIWFFSLDASNPVAALGARLTFHLPYFNARMSLEQRDHTIQFISRRTRPHAAPAEFEAVWTIGNRFAAVRAGFPAVFPNRAVCSVFRTQRCSLPRSNFPSALAAARSTPRLVSLEYDRITGVAFSRRRCLATPTGRPFEGRSLASSQD